MYSREKKIKEEIKIIESDIDQLKEQIDRCVQKVKEKKELVRYFKNQL